MKKHFYLEISSLVMDAYVIRNFCNFYHLAFLKNILYGVFERKKHSLVKHLSKIFIFTVHNLGEKS